MSGIYWYLISCLDFGESGIENEVEGKTDERSCEWLDRAERSWVRIWWEPYNEVRKL